MVSQWWWWWPTILVFNQSQTTCSLGWHDLRTQKYSTKQLWCQCNKHNHSLDDDQMEETSSNCWRLVPMNCSHAVACNGCLSFFFAFAMWQHHGNRRSRTWSMSNRNNAMNRQMRNNVFPQTLVHIQHDAPHLPFFLLCETWDMPHWHGAVSIPKCACTKEQLFLLQS